MRSPGPNESTPVFSLPFWPSQLSSRIESQLRSYRESELQLSSTFVRKRLKVEVDYVIRRFNLFSAQLNKPQGLDLRRDTV